MSTLILWTLKTPTAAQIEALESQLGGVEVDVVSGVEALYTTLENTRLPRYFYDRTSPVP